MILTVIPTVNRIVILKELTALPSGATLMIDHNRESPLTRRGNCHDRC
jgi:hypothetical protein